MTEKHGAIWGGDSSDRIAFEHYDAASDLLGVVFTSPSGGFRAVVFEKVSDPQWELPGWSDRRPDALFTDLSEAVRFLRDLLKK